MSDVVAFSRLVRFVPLSYRLLDHSLHLHTPAYPHDCRSLASLKGQIIKPD